MIPHFEPSLGALSLRSDVMSSIKIIYFLLLEWRARAEHRGQGSGQGGRRVYSCGGAACVVCVGGQGWEGVEQRRQGGWGRYLEEGGLPRAGHAVEEVGALVGDAVRGVELIRILRSECFYQLGAGTYQLIHISTCQQNQQSYYISKATVPARQYQQFHCIGKATD